MQRYRVNYVLLIVLVVGTLVGGVGIHYLWRYQVSKNADRLLAKADASEASGDIDAAFESLLQYIQLRPKDGNAKIRSGEIAAKAVETEGLDMELRSKAFGR